MNHHKCHLDGPAELTGRAVVPPSKSHTIRALLIAALSEGCSTIINPLDAGDTRSARKMIEQFGARVTDVDNGWLVEGIGADWQHLHRRGAVTIDVGNSGTSLYLATAIAALADFPIHFTGDSSIRRRSSLPLLTALQQMGASINYQRSTGYAPYSVCGPIRAAELELRATTSQYLSALLLSAPLIRGSQGGTTIKLLELNEKPYIDMTLDWLRRQQIQFNCLQDYSSFTIPNQQHYQPFTTKIPGDYSSATFLLCAAAISQSHIQIDNLPEDVTQGDHKVVEMLQRMGADISRSGDSLNVRPAVLHGQEIDLNDTPDALPALAVTACFAGGVTRLVNVAQAKIKETNRIQVMADELRKLGAEIEVNHDGLTIFSSGHLHPNFVCGHNDHRVVMALAIASLAMSGGLTIDDVSSAAVTFPDFFAQLERLRRN